MREVRPAQVDIADHIVETVLKYNSCAVFASMGVGKSGATLVALDTLDMLGEEVYPVLIAAPLRVAKNTWPEEMEAWSGILPDVTMSAIVGSPLDRMMALKKKVKIYTINMENVEWLVDHLCGEWPFKVLVVDESSCLAGLRVHVRTESGGKPCTPHLAGQGSKRAKALVQLVWKHKCKVIELTGTPCSNGLQKLWGQLFFLDFGKRLGRTFDSFTKRWFNVRQTADGYSDIRPTNFAQEQIQNAVKDICRTFDAKDYYDVKDAVTIPVWVTLPPAAMRKYKDMEKTFFMEIEGHQIEAFSAGTKSMKLAQIANGAAYVGEDDGSDQREWVLVHDEKLEALNSIIEESGGMPVLVIYWFKSDLARLKKRFPEGVHLDQKKETEDRWNRGEIPILFIHYQSAGHGLNLQHGSNICAIFGMTWSLEWYLQVIERIGPMRQMQSGYDRVVFVYLILAKGTIDEDMLERQATKKSVQDLLLEAAKRRK